jgi:hypothetical protein
MDMVFKRTPKQIEESRGFGLRLNPILQLVGVYTTEKATECLKVKYPDHF